MVDATTPAPQQITLPQAIVIKDLAELLRVPVHRVVSELMKNGVMSSMNERIDFETAAIIAEELGFSATLKEEDDTAALKTTSQTLHEYLQRDVAERQVTRAPVVIVMGHVDHGKTKLLDAIRETDVVAGEAGGITQHIGAYQVSVPLAQEQKPRENGTNRDGARKSELSQTRKITFIDTPGHEAFTAMRSRGAQVADVAILVVAADDGIKPQTLEALKIIQQAQLPFVVAINKIDKPEANVEHVKQQLAAQNLLPEDWGGKVTTVPVSAHTRAGIPELLDTVLLVADLEPERLRADPQRDAVGVVIDAHIDKGEGPVATVLVKTGTLHRGDFVRIGTIAGKVKALKDWRGNNLDAAIPSTPAKMLGLKIAPQVGDVLATVDADEAKRLRREHKLVTERSTKRVVYTSKKEQQAEEQEVSAKRVTQHRLNIILRTDNLGSQEAILESLHRFETPYAAVEVVAKGLGNITDADVLRAETAKAKLLGFHVLPTPRALEVAKSKQAAIRTYTVIYDLLNDVRQELEALLPTEVTETVLGHLMVLGVFRKEKRAMIVGGKVTDGVLRKGARLRVQRSGQTLADGTIVQLQLEQRPVDEVQHGGTCGIRFEGDPVIEQGDTLEAYTREEHRIIIPAAAP